MSSPPTGGRASAARQSRLGAAGNGRATGRPNLGHDQATPGGDLSQCAHRPPGHLVTWQLSRFDRKPLLRSYAAAAAAYPDAEVIFLAHDNWPVHVHPDVLAALPPKLVLLPLPLSLPTSAPWTNPVEDVWRALNGDVLHRHGFGHHGFGDDWTGLQAAVTTWLGQGRDPSPALLYRIGLVPCPG